jgi:hypothetical protein
MYRFDASGPSCNASRPGNPIHAASASRGLGRRSHPVSALAAIEPAITSQSVPLCSAVFGDVNVALRRFAIDP